MHNYDTVTAAVNGLRQRGFTHDLSLEQSCLLRGEEKFNPEDFEITEVYRFEGDTDPADEAVVYGVEGKGAWKGVLITGYGASAEGISSDMARKLAIHNTNS